MSSCGCDDSCNPPKPIDVEPCREPLDCTPPPDCCTHCLLGKFAALYPQYNCDETATYRICLLLHQAEELVGGIVSGPKREMAIMFAVLHMLETQNNAMLRAQAQSAAIAFGEAPQISAPGSSGWWGLTDWGLMVEQLLSVNDRISFVMI